MKVLRSIKKIHDLISAFKKQGRTIGFVPTMGYLHEGHLSLLFRAKQENDICVLSIYVNPAQFGPKEDFKKYPRDLSRDLRLARDVGVDIVFCPADKAMYPQGYLTHVVVEKLSEGLCGLSRPGHFQGVATIVAKLFNIIEPDIAYFGQKDAQQALVIKKMASDLNMPVKIKVMPIVREIDGLAMSSRNKYLTLQERTDAAVLNRALRQARKSIADGEINPVKILSSIKKLISSKHFAKIDYIQIVDPRTLLPVKTIKGTVLIALAVYIGKTRLIDNVMVPRLYMKNDLRLGGSHGL